LNIQIIVPCYNEETIIKKTNQKLLNTINNFDSNFKFNILYINDGSSDKTLQILKNINENYINTDYISFSRNFGKEAAMYAGLKNSVNFDAVIIIDSDLQHPPELIPFMIEEFTKGYDQVIAKRNRVGESLIRKLPTRFYYWLINKFVDIPIPDGIGDFRLLSNKTVNSIVALNETQRFSKGIFSWVGYNQKIIKYDNVERQSGNSKWSAIKLLDYGVDGIISFNNKPLRLMLYLGLITFFISLLYIIITFIQILTKGISEPGYFTIIFSILFLGSVQLISLGIVGEYIGRIYYEVKARPHYLIDEKSSTVGRIENENE